MLLLCSFIVNLTRKAVKHLTVKNHMNFTYSMNVVCRRYGSHFNFSTSFSFFSTFSLFSPFIFFVRYALLFSYMLCLFSYATFSPNIMHVVRT